VLVVTIVNNVNTRPCLAVIVQMREENPKKIAFVSFQAGFFHRTRLRRQPRNGRLASATTRFRILRKDVAQQVGKVDLLPRLVPDLVSSLHLRVSSLTWYTGPIPDVGSLLLGLPPPNTTPIACVVTAIDDQQETKEMGSGAIVFLDAASNS